MNTHMVFKQAQQLIAENSAALLTGTGVIGVVTTAVLTGRASFKAAELINGEYKSRSMDGKDTLAPELPSVDKVKLVGLLYIPAIASGITTIGAIVFSYRISVSKSAALAAAYGISEKAFSGYKEKVLEHVSPKKAIEIEDDVAREQMTKNPPPSSQIMVIADGDMLCLDSFSGRYFRSSIEKIRRAENDILMDINNRNEGTLGDFYEKIGLPQTDIHEHFKWTLNNLIETQFTTTITDDGRPCVVITFVNAPAPKYDEFT